ncbi:hypothetical protein YK48G_10090 [Lentilactobacillus fungorum]|uniref:Uncharacterized protein n=1 Tax=Lentilactobacillus fungorum TaxID=2201250 RepID=A0ABQ3W1N5_9LACO|nr:hypothetical protein [Lentilactobacillus fungorum]GHP13584.1 hypothetical protein YK48G_10090 [Lentilactobacillus fungorum]
MYKRLEGLILATLAVVTTILGLILVGGQSAKADNKANDMTVQVVNT